MDEDVFDVEIKNDKLEALIDWAFDNWDSNDISWSKMSNQEAGEKLISIFACDMLINAHKVGTKLDFTYDTLKICLSQRGDAFRDTWKAASLSESARIL